MPQATESREPALSALKLLAELASGVGRKTGGTGRSLAVLGWLSFPGSQGGLFGLCMRRCAGDLQFCAPDFFWTLTYCYLSPACMSSRPPVKERWTRETSSNVCEQQGCNDVIYCVLAQPFTPQMFVNTPRVPLARE